MQAVWNDFKNKLTKVVDKIVPLTEFKNNLLLKSPNKNIKRKKNVRKRLLINFKVAPTPELKNRIQT